MKQDYPKWIYNPKEDARIIEEGPIPEGWFDSPSFTEAPKPKEPAKKRSMNPFKAKK